VYFLLFYPSIQWYISTKENYDSLSKEKGKLRPGPKLSTIQLHKTEENILETEVATERGGQSVSSLVLSSDPEQFPKKEIRKKHSSNCGNRKGGHLGLPKVNKKPRK
jgi:hypothetical protein